MTFHNKSLCVALDVDSAQEAKRIVRELKNYVTLFKVGSQLFTKEGPNIVKDIIGTGCRVFLDLKYHDIPNTIRGAARAATGLGVSIFNVHSTGGLEMMSAAANAVKEEAVRLKTKKPIVLGVTVLTSIDEKILKYELKTNAVLSEYVTHLAILSKQAGLDGVVASPLEIELIRASCGDDFKIVTPGVRPANTLKVSGDDQKRVMTPGDAVKAGADYIVVGRPIYGSDNPAMAARQIVTEIKG